MKINKNAFKMLIDSNFEGNYSKCARALGVNVSSVSRLLSGEQGLGVKILNGLMSYCEKNKLDVREYIFFTTPVA